MPLSILQAPKSLTRQTLLKMSIRIAIVIILTTLISYWHVVSVLKSQSLEQLEKYIIERGQRESSIFTLAQDNHQILKQAFYQHLEELAEHEPQAQFEQRFVKWADGTTRNRLTGESPKSLDTTRYPSVFIGKNVTINTEIKRRVLAFYDLLSRYGPAWRSRFVDTYFLSPENIVVNYWPDVPWALNAPATLNIHNEEYFYVSDSQHNPTRKTAWTGLYFDHVVELWMVSVETPVDDAQGRHIATIGNDIILNELMERTIHDTLEGAYNLILRADGRLIVHPDKLTEIQKQGGQFDILKSGDQHLMRIFELVKNIPENQVVMENLVEDEYLAVTQIEGPQWYFVTVYPKSLLSVPAFQTARFILILGLISLLIEVLILFLILRTQVAKPLQNFIVATQHIAAGHFRLDTQPDEQGHTLPYRLPVERSDELGQLAQSLQSMTAQLQTSFDTLETQNAEFQAIMADIIQVSQGLAAGNLYVTLQADYPGELAQIKTAIERALCDLRQVTEDILQVSQGLAVGNLQVMPIAEYRGDFMPIKDALVTALTHMRQVVEDIVLISKGLLLGDFSMGAQAQYPGEFVTIHDALVTALVNLSQLIEDIVHSAQQLAEGNLNFTPKAEYVGEFLRIKVALEMATTKLAEATSKNAVQDWLKTGQAQLNDQMSGEQDITTLAKNIIACLTNRMDAQVGMFYLVEELNRHNHTCHLKMLADYTRTQHKNVAMAFKFSEGMVGQAALDKQNIRFTIDAGLAESIPQHLLAVPFSYEDIVKGVIELGFVETVTETQLEFLSQAMPNIGIAVNTAESRTQMQALLQQTQAQSGELQRQQDELQQSNDKLQIQSERLQNQQEELRQSNEELEERTRELERQTGEIQQKNLALEKTKVEMEKAQLALEKKAEELTLASQYKSEFLANISHELRTPLNSMLILAQLLVENKNGNLTVKQVESARTIYSAGSDLLRLINDILDLSKVEAGKMTINVESVSIVEQMEMIEQKFRPVADEKGLAFHIQVATDLPPILHTDGQRFQQIINNLLSNAFKFTAQGEVKLDLQPATESPVKSGESGIVISVTDTGIGIPENKQKLIFEAFQQADGTTSRSYGGTGLGLSISRQLARLLGGELHLFSELGKGSQFTLYLPANPSIPATASMPPESLGKESSQPQVVTNCEPIAHHAPVFESVSEQTVTVNGKMEDRKPLSSAEDKSLLIIEDDRLCSNRLTALATEKNFKCLIAEDTQTGLQLIQEHLPNAILLNVDSPHIDAWAIMNRLKDNHDTRRIPVHLMSATEPNMDIKSMGAIGYLHKPVSLEQLGDAFKKIEQVMTRQVKDLLVAVDNEQHQQTILELVGGGEIQTTLAVTMAIALQHLKQTPFDCLILDMDIEQGSGLKLLEKMQQGNGLCQTPVIIYAERDLTASEEDLLQQCANDMLVNPVKSQEHLLEEATLFLHQLESHLPVHKRKMLRMVHDKEAILRHKKVLIADDDMRNTYAVASVLEDREMEIVCAKNGSDALTKLAEHEDIAIVLMDIMMPEKDGYQTIQAIRNQPRFHKLPIIALTAKAMKGDRTKCIEAGANDYLSKPVDNDKLISLMRVWLYR